MLNNAKQCRAMLSSYTNMMITSFKSDSENLKKSRLSPSTCVMITTLYVFFLKQARFMYVGVMMVVELIIKTDDIPLIFTASSNQNA